MKVKRNRKRRGRGRRWLWAALALDCRFAVAPPLLVAFTEFSSPTAAARKRPFRAGAAIFLCALAGTASRLLLQGALGLPLTGVDISKEAVRAAAAKRKPTAPAPIP